MTETWRWSQGCRDVSKKRMCHLQEQVSPQVTSVPVEPGRCTWRRRSSPRCQTRGEGRPQGILAVFQATVPESSCSSFQIPQEFNCDGAGASLAYRGVPLSPLAWHLCISPWFSVGLQTLITSLPSPSFSASSSSSLHLPPPCLGGPLSSLGESLLPSLSPQGGPDQNVSGR